MWVRHSKYPLLLFWKIQFSQQLQSMTTNQQPKVPLIHCSSEVTWDDTISRHPLKSKQNTQSKHLLIWAYPYDFVSALGSYKMGHHKYSVIIIIIILPQFPDDKTLLNMQYQRGCNQWVGVPETIKAGERRGKLEPLELGESRGR